MINLKMVALLPLIILLSACSTIKVAQLDAADRLSTCAEMKPFMQSLFDHDAQYYSCSIYESANGKEGLVDVRITVNKKDVSVICDVFWSDKRLIFPPMYSQTLPDLPGYKPGAKISCEGYLRYKRDGSTMRI